MSVSKRELWTALSLYGDPAVAGAEAPGPRRRNAHPEQGVLNAVLKVLRMDKRVAWVARINSGAYRTPDGRFIRFGFPGCPDLIGQMKPLKPDQPGGFLALEIKSEQGRATEAQRAAIEHIGAHGGCSGVVRSVADCQKILDEYAVRFG